MKNSFSLSTKTRNIAKTVRRLEWREGGGKRERESGKVWQLRDNDRHISSPSSSSSSRKRAKRPSFCPQSPAPEFRNLPPIFQSRWKRTVVGEGQTRFSARLCPFDDGDSEPPLEYPTLSLSPSSGRPLCSSNSRIHI